MLWRASSRRPDGSPPRFVESRRYQPIETWRWQTTHTYGIGKAAESLQHITGLIPRLASLQPTSQCSGQEATRIRHRDIMCHHGTSLCLVLNRVQVISCEAIAHYNSSRPATMGSEKTGRPGRFLFSGGREPFALWTWKSHDASLAYGLVLFSAPVLTAGLM